MHSRVELREKKGTVEKPIKSSIKTLERSFFMQKFSGEQSRRPVFLSGITSSVKYVSVYNMI
jgi:hypothetical protein